MKRHKPIPKKKSWLARAIETYNYHANRVKDNPSQTLEDTALELNRSLGSISEDILLASWSRSHDLTKFKRAYEALLFIRMKKKFNRTIEIDGD